jgi:hypothetical protein
VWLVRLGAAAGTMLASGSSGRDAASSTLAIVGILIGVGALVVIFGGEDGARRRGPDDRRRRIALILFGVAGFMLAAGIFVASL